jgi:hypothetical protein
MSMATIGGYSLLPKEETPPMPKSNNQALGRKQAGSDIFKSQNIEDQ